VIRPIKGKNEDPVLYDRRCVEPYTKALASRPGRTILTVHHARKEITGDVADSASGTLGITSAVDGALFLHQNQDGAMVLTGQGRDLTPFDYEVKLNAPLWSIIGDADAGGLSETRAKIIAAMVPYAMGCSPKTVADTSGIDVNNVKQQLRRMCVAGFAKREGRGNYILTPKGSSLGLMPGVGEKPPIPYVPL